MVCGIHIPESFDRFLHLCLCMLCKKDSIPFLRVNGDNIKKIKTRSLPQSKYIIKMRTPSVVLVLMLASKDWNLLSFRTLYFD